MSSRPWHQQFALSPFGCVTVAQLASLTVAARPLTAAALEMPSAQLRRLAGRTAAFASARRGTAKPSDRPSDAFRASGNGFDVLACSLAPEASPAAVAQAASVRAKKAGRLFSRRKLAAIALPRMRFHSSRGLRPRFGLAEKSQGPAATCSPVQRSPSASRRHGKPADSQAFSGQLPLALRLCAAALAATTCTTPLPGLVRHQVCSITGTCT